MISNRFPLLPTCESRRFVIIIFASVIKHGSNAQLNFLVKIFSNRHPSRWRLLCHFNSSALSKDITQKIQAVKARSVKTKPQSKNGQPGETISSNQKVVRTRRAILKWSHNLKTS
jgi:hypothetical protein